MRSWTQKPEYTGNKGLLKGTVHPQINSDKVPNWWCKRKQTSLKTPSKKPLRQTPVRVADLRVPGALRYGVLEVGTCESRARHEVDVLLGVEAHLLQKGHQLLLALLIPAGESWKRGTISKHIEHQALVHLLNKTAASANNSLLDGYWSHSAVSLLLNNLTLGVGGVRDTA